MTVRAPGRTLSPDLSLISPLLHSHLHSHLRIHLRSHRRRNVHATSTSLHVALFPR